MKLTKKSTTKTTKTLTMLKSKDENGVRHYVKIGAHWYGCLLLNSEAAKVVADFKG